MIKYEIRMTKESVPRVFFENQEYELVSTFLLAEGRSFFREIMEAVDKVCEGREKEESFSGNVFSLEIRPDNTLVEDDILGKECLIPTQELRQILVEFHAYGN